MSDLVAVATIARPLAALGILAATAWIVGDALLGARLGRLGAAERWALATTLGLGAIGQGMLLLGLIGLLDRKAVLAAVAAVHLLGWRRWRDRGATALGWVAGRARGGGVLVLVGVFAVGPCLVLALYPPTGFDATLYHLPYVRAFLAAGGTVFVPELRFPVFPQLIEMVFVLAFQLGGELAAHLTQVLSMVLVAVLLLAWGRRLPGPTGRWAAALWLGTPLVARIASSAYIDVGFTLFVTAGLFAWERWREDRWRAEARWWLALAGACVGCAAGAKYLGLFFFGVLTALTLAGARRRAARELVPWLLAFAVVAAPWYWRIVHHTGNPLFPFYEPLFGASEWTSHHDRASPGVSGVGPAAVPSFLAGQAGRVWDGLRFLVLTPWNAVFGRAVFHFQAPLTPWYLLLIPLALPWALGGAPSRRLAAVAGLYALFWLTTLREVRFLIAALPLVDLVLAAGLAAGLRRLARRSAAVRRHRHRLVAAAAVALLLPGPLYGLYKIGRQGPLPRSAAERAAYLRAQIPGYAAIDWLNRRHGASYSVYALFGERLRYYADGRFLGDWTGPHRFSQVQVALNNGPRLAAVLEDLGVCYFLLPKPVAAGLPADVRKRLEPQPVGGDFRLFRLRTASCSR